MTAEAFYEDRDDRTHRYAGRVLDPARTIAIVVEPEFLARPEGQAAAMVAANLLGRMTPRVALCFPNFAIHDDLPWRGRSLHEAILRGMRAADPHGSFDARAQGDGDYVLNLGRDGHDWVAHGSGWNAYVGPAPSPLANESDGNLFGAMFAAILAVALIFEAPFPEAIAPPRFADLLRWEPAAGAPGPSPQKGADLGRLWIVGAGSVGTAAAYFLAIAGFRFGADLVDMDMVKVHNLDRSPVFESDDVGKAKVVALARFLAEIGIEATPEAASLGASTLWQGRQEGVPDLMISAANEDNVRYETESLYPPIQIFGTTGAQWQSTVLRLVPPTDACSCCVFPPERPQSTKCAEGEVADPGNAEKSVDAALPFLSFAAGLMAAAEIAKLGLPGAPFSDNRAFFYPRSDEVVAVAGAQRRTGCVCADRRPDVHRRMVGDSRYAGLCDFPAPKRNQGG